MKEKLRQLLSDMVTHIENVGGKDLKIDETIPVIIELCSHSTIPMIPAEVFFPIMDDTTTRIQAQKMSELVESIQKKERKPRKKAKRDKKKRIRILTEEELKIKRGEK